MLWRPGYNLVLLIGLIVLAPFWMLYLLLVPKTRAGFWEKLGYLRREVKAKLAALPQTSRVWVHTVSVGEFQAAKPLIQRLLDNNTPVIISTTTATGQALARSSFPQLPVLYFPFDLPGSLDQAFRQINPEVIVVLETEIWPNLLWLAADRDLPVLMINGRLSRRSFKGYHHFRSFFQTVLNQYRLLLMQSEGDSERMRALGVNPEKIRTAGNIKFDIAPLVPTPLQATLAQCFAFPDDAPVVVFASTHDTEEQRFIAVLKQLQAKNPNLRAIFVPRHPERFDTVSDLLTQGGLPHSRRSQLQPDCPNTQPVVLLDSIGELNTVYTLATLACMGGSFAPIGGHNPLEPINAQIPVVFGPHMENFQDIARRVIEAGAGFQATDEREAAALIHELLSQPSRYQEMVAQGQALMAANRGAIQVFLDAISAILWR